MTPSKMNPAENRRVARLMIGVFVLLGLAVASAFAYYFIFSRSSSLDEGYLMITVQGFNSGHALYDTLFTQYGPFYYFYEWLLRSVLAIPLTHDATRFLCIAHWLMAAGILGVAAWKLTRSTMAGFFVAFLAVTHLATLAHEPGHPQEIVAVLLAFGALFAVRFARGGWAIEALAVVAVLLAFTKINVGIFFGFALLLTMRCHSADRFSRGIWNWLLLGVCAVLPFLLVRRHLSQEWCRNFALVIASTGVTVLFVAQRASTQRPLNPASYFRAAAAFLIPAAILLAVTLFTGTSWNGLFEGLILTPLKMPSVTLLAIPMPNVALLNAAASLAIAVWVICKRDDARLAILVPALKTIFAVVGAFCLMGNAKSQLAFLVPWVWLVGAPVANTRDENAHGNFGRTFLALAAVWQSLQIYPVAGTQVTIATLFLVMAYGVCLSDAVQAMTQNSRVGATLAAFTPMTRNLTQALASAALLFLFANGWCKLPDVRREYARLRPLGLPGSSHIRMDDETVTMYGDLAQYLAAESSTFVTYPGVNSLYFWADKRPPTQLNSTGWGQLTHTQQREILDALAKAEKPRLVVVEAMMQDWDSAAYEPIRPLVRFVAEDCRPLRRVGRFIIFEPKPNAISTASR
jgi:hypothetical protein